MFSKSQIKLITSLKQKKYRQQHNLFVVEGIKSVQEFIQAGWKLYALYETENFFREVNISRYAQVKENDLSKISFLTTPQKVLAVFYKPEDDTFIASRGLTLVLDDIRDPGNLGTIIRLCDWFGVEQLICSQHTVDAYNPKVVQATMGSLARLPLRYVDLQAWLNQNTLPVYGAFMDGQNVYTSSMPHEAVLILGNEANGISKNVESYVSRKIAIPQLGSSKTESLNVATAGAILLSEFARNSFTEK